MKNIQIISDKIAIVMSVLCVIHCLFLPLLVIALPAFVGLAFLKNETFHIWLVFGIVPISLIAIFIGFHHNKNSRVLITTFFGLGILVFAAFLGHDLVGEFGEVTLTVVGSLIMTYGHYLNFRQSLRGSCLNSTHVSCET